MARERESILIDGHRYEMTMLGATAGYQLFCRLFRMLGPSFGAIMDAVGGTDSIEDADLSSEIVVKAIRMLADEVKESDLDHLVERLRSQTHVGINGSDKTVPLSSVFELHFAGDILGLGKWVVWGLKVQYATFAGAFATLSPPVAGGAIQAATSPSP